MKKIFYMIIALSLFSCKQYKPLLTVSSVDLVKYKGVWYEIAAFPQSFEKGCSCTSAEYILTDKNYVRVVNTCMKDGKLNVAKGKAFVVKGSNNSKLKVQFFWPFKGNYWIIYLNDDYTTAAVGDPSRKYLWILHRSKTMDDTNYAALLVKLTAMDFDVSKLKKTEQPCDK
jgi:apolipoprotein D and lipocalin family protein